MGSDVGLEVVDNALLALQGEWPGWGRSWLLRWPSRGCTSRKVWMV